MRAEFADVLERFASQVIELRGVSRTRPHLFAEGKDELAKAMQRAAAAYRLAMPRIATIATDAASIKPGTRRVGQREVVVEVRGRRRA